MQKIPKFVVATVIIQLGMLMGAVPGIADPSCSFANGVFTVTDDRSTGQDRIDVWQDTDDHVWATVGVKPEFPPADTFCSGTPVSTSSITSIKITGGTASDSLYVWLSRSQADVIPVPPSPLGGPAADWGTITWNVDLGASRQEKDILYVYDIGETNGLTLTGGDSGIDLDGDHHLDVTYSSSLAKIDVIVLMGSAGGKNVITMGGDATTGDAVRIRTGIGVVEVPNDPSTWSNDTLTGGSGRDSIVGGGGNDRISGGAGDDMLLGGSGNDRIFGGSGHDGIQGGTGHDVCVGGPGRDNVVCEVG